MSTINDTDQFLVQRGTNSYKQSAVDLMSTIQDTDLMLIQRGENSYKVTCLDVKDQLGGGGGGIQPGPNDIIITPTPPGAGTQADPYILTAVRVGPFGATVESTEEISLTGQPFNADVIWTDNSVGAGNRFNQPQGITSGTGTWTGRVQYADVPASTVDTNYTGDLQLGALFFRWTVEQVENADLPTSIQNVSLVENNPGAAPRFTDQNFTLTTQITDGVPVAEKTIDAYVEGTIKTRPETDTIASATTAGVGSPQVFESPGGSTTRTERSPIFQNGVYFYSTGQSNFGEITSSQDPTFATSTPYYDHIACCKVSDYAIAFLTPQGAVKVISCLDWDDWLNGTVIAESNTYSSLAMSQWGNIRGLQFTMNPGGGDEAQRGRAGFVVEYNSPNNNNTPVYAIRFHPELKQFDTEWMSVSGPSSNVGMRTVACDQKQGYVWAFSGNASGGIKVWRARFPSGTPTSNKSLNFSDIGNQGITPNMNVGNPYVIDSIWCNKRDIVYAAVSDGQFYAGAPGSSATGFLSAGTFTPQNESNALCNIGTSDGDVFLVRETGEYQIRRYTDQTSYSTLSSGTAGSGYGAQGRRAVKDAPNFLQISNPKGLLITPQTSTVTFNSSQNFDEFAVGEEVIQQPTALDRTGVTIRSIDSANSQMVTSVANGWAVGEKVYGPEKTVANTTKYLSFDSSGNVTDLLSSPQSPAYKTTDTNPGLVFKFPSTFPSGNAPDDELGDGTTLTVAVTSTNATSSEGPVTAVVQPDFPVGPSLNGLIQLYTGNNLENPIVNGIDLAGDGGMVWTKARNDGTGFYLVDTVRTRAHFLMSNNDQKQSAGSPANTDLASFNSDGYTLNSNWDGYFNTSTKDFVSWSFQKKPEYFTVVQYIGNGQPNRVVPHNLGAVPGMIICKSMDEDVTDWPVYHKDLDIVGAAETLYLNKYGQASSGDPVWAQTLPTDSQFTVSADNSINQNGKRYIAYLFAADNPGVIKCGTYQGTNQPFNLELGFEAQWLMIVAADRDGNFIVVDEKRGNGADAVYPNQTFTENNDNCVQFGYATGVSITAQIFVQNAASQYNNNGTKFLYMAIGKEATRSMTTEEFAQEAAMFATYENRRDVHQGELAMEKRESLKRELQAAGVDPPAIDKLLGGTSK